MRHRVVLWVGLVVLVLGSATIAANGLLRCDDPIAADTPSQVSYSFFSGMTSGQMWHAIDTLQYWAIPLTPPEGYYDSVNATSPEALRLTLHALISEHCVHPYTSSASRSAWPEPGHKTVDVWDILAIADASPADPTRVVDIYANRTFPRQSHGGSGESFYNREHSWPKSYGFDSMVLSNPAYTDCHHLFPAWWNYNSSRGDCPFGSVVSEVGAPRGTDVHLGRGGSVEQANVRFARTEQGVNSCLWEVWCGRRGDVARALFYMAVRYEGGVDCRDCNGKAVSEPDLRLTDDLLDTTP